MKTLGDINRFIDKLQYEMWEIPPNLELKITLGMDDYIKIQKELISIVGNTPIHPENKYKHAVENTWMTYQYMGIKTTIELQNSVTK